MSTPIRAGGHVLGRSGWELEHPPRPAQPVLTETEQEADRQAAMARALPTEPESVESPADDRDRADCPDCGKDVAVNKDGTLRKHTCVIEAAPPQVTFDREEDHGGDPAPEDR